MRRAALLLLVLPLAFGAAPTTAGADPPLLIGTVGPGFTIDLTDANGQHVTTLTAGTYTLLVHDLSDVHNFALGSQTTNTRILTGSVEGVGDEHFTLNVTPGSYAYACSAHPDVMNGTFRVVAAPKPVTPSLSAKVTSKAVSLSSKKVTAGSYSLTVSDGSKTRNFHLVGPGVNRKTSKKFVGKSTWQVVLGAGVYRFGNDPRLTGRLTVSAS
jgi:plastocyanin